MKKKIILSTVLPIMGAVGVGGAIAAVSTSCSKVESFDQKLELKYDNSDKR
jgi:hypothetical protein